MNVFLVKNMKDMKGEKTMHVDKYVVNNIGTKWTNGKSKKNQLLASLDGTDGIDLRKLVPLVEQWHETVNGEWATRDIEVIINVRDTEDGR
jgi:hypothetical protein